MKKVFNDQIKAMLGTMTDKALAEMVGVQENRVMIWRHRYNVPTYRSTTLAPKVTSCAMCNKEVTKKAKDFRRSENLFCSHDCSSQFQKKRDMEMLRYGKGWKQIREKVRKRDKVCQVCLKTEDMGLEVHHLVPYRFGGKNTMDNLIALCRSCHHKVEARNNKLLSQIKITAKIENGLVTMSIYAPNAEISEKI